MKLRAQIVTFLSAQTLAYGSMLLEPAETRPRSNLSCLHPLPHKSLPERRHKNRTSAVNNTVNELILDKGSCEKLQEKIRFANLRSYPPSLYLDAGEEGRECLIAG